MPLISTRRDTFSRSFLKSLFPSSHSPSPFSAYRGILTLAGCVDGGISLFITNAIRLHHSLSLLVAARYDRRLRQASLATREDRKKVICRPDPSWDRTGDGGFYVPVSMGRGYARRPPLLPCHRLRGNP